MESCRTGTSESYPTGHHLLVSWARLVLMPASPRCISSRLLTLTRRPYGLPVPYRKFQERFAEILASHDGRPHWAKQHALKPKDFEALYPKFSAYRDVLARVDPAGIMRSEYVRRHIEGENIPDRVFKKRPQ